MPSRAQIETDIAYVEHEIVAIRYMRDLRKHTYDKMGYFSTRQENGKALTDIERYNNELNDLEKRLQELRYMRKFAN